MYNMTAVEWVFDKMLDIAAGNSSLTTQEILEKGREMEEKQITTTKLYCIDFRIGFVTYLNSKGLKWFSKEIKNEEGKTKTQIFVEAENDTAFFDMVYGYGQSDYNYLKKI